MPCCLRFFLVLITLSAGVHAQTNGTFNIRDFGAAGDGIAKDTEAVQATMDACSLAGGGTVLFPPGKYLCGSLRLGSHTRVFLEQGAVLLGSRKKSDYNAYEALPFKNDADHETSFFRLALLWGEDIEDIRIEGGGVIDANFEKRGGPKPISFKRCRFVDILGIRILNAPNYAISLLGTDDVNIDGVTILNGFADGIDPDSCKNVRIANCRIETVDDAIVPKASFSLGERRVCEQITVTNCILSTVCNGFKLGTESGGGFRRIAVTNCVITGAPYKGRSFHAISGIAIESVDGGILEDVVISNITMHNVRAPIFIRLGNRGRDMETPVAGALRNVSISNITASRASLPSCIVGIPGHPVEGVSLSDIRVEVIGGNAWHPAEAPVPEKIAQYPEALMFGSLPAYGFYVRHAKDLSLRNIAVSYADNFWRLTTEVYRDVVWPDANSGAPPSHSEPGHAGHAFFLEDVEDLRMDGFRARASKDGMALLRLNDVRRVVVGGSTPGEAIVAVGGEKTASVYLEGDAFSDETVRVGTEVLGNAVRMDATE
jgi:polygalacturonase